MNDELRAIPNLHNQDQKFTVTCSLLGLLSDPLRDQSALEVCLIFKTRKKKFCEPFAISLCIVARNYAMEVTLDRDLEPMSGQFIAIYESHGEALQISGCRENETDLLPRPETRRTVIFDTDLSGTPNIRCRSHATVSKQDSSCLVRDARVPPCRTTQRDLV